MADPIDFTAEFQALTGHTPFGWQTRLFDDYFTLGQVPGALDLPTGLGKTSVMAIWYLAHMAGSALPRRLVYVVDRRAVVDQATSMAETIKQNAAALPLYVSTLRGQYVDNRNWLANPAALAIIVGTVDMIGSRLLFSGYGVSPRMRPYHAGLLGADTLVVLDESHLVPPFEKLMEQIAGDDALRPAGQRERDIVPALRLLPLSATHSAGTTGKQAFRLTDQDAADKIIGQRLTAPKRLRTVPLDGKLDSTLAAEAWRLAAAHGPIRCLVYCNSREIAYKTKAEIEKLALGGKGKKAAQPDLPSIELFVGARRVKERESAAARLAELGFLAGHRVALERPAFVIATSAGEVGVDLDADHAVMDLVPFERMVQRLGRVNRLGAGDAKITLVDNLQSLKDDDKPILEHCLALLRRLPDDGQGRDVSPAALADLKTRHAEKTDAGSTPPPLYPALSRALVESWAMTSLKEHTGRPEIGPWLRGWVEDEPTAAVVWRRYLPVREGGGEVSSEEIAEFFDAAQIHLAERLETDAWQIEHWLKERAKKKLYGLERKPGKKSAEESGEPDLELRKDTVIAMAFDPAGAHIASYSSDQLGGDGIKQRKGETVRGGTTWVLDARFGGLSRDGLLDSDVDTPAIAADDGSSWPEVGFTIASTKVLDERRQKPHYFAVERNNEGEDLRYLVVERLPGALVSENGRSLSPRPQLLEDHSADTAQKAEALVAALGLPEDLAQATILAARLHDEGKKARIWQSAFHAPADAIYAKTKGPVDYALLGGYRHEFGSLFHIARDNMFGDLDDGLKDLVLHLVAAHHGRARPAIESARCEEAPPSVLKERAGDVALRYARMQKRWGPWGLAWFEAILRAADQQASRNNDSR